MFLDLVFGGLVLWMIAAGLYQLTTGRDAWIATFPSSRRTPGRTEIRISGAAALVVGVALVPVFAGLIHGALRPGWVSGRMADQVGTHPNRRETS